MKTLLLVCALLTALLTVSRLAAAGAPSALVPRYE